MSPGTRNSALRSAGLYQTRGSTESAGPGGVDVPEILDILSRETG